MSRPPLQVSLFVDRRCGRNVCPDGKSVDGLSLMFPMLRFRAELRAGVCLAKRGAGLLPSSRLNIVDLLAPDSDGDFLGQRHC